MRTGELGFWWRSLGGPPPPRAPLAGPLEVDVAIVGAGYTGLWTAYYLKRAQPSLSIAVLEREVAGFGASGRNGGWVSGFFAGPARVFERRGGKAGYAALRRAMFATVDEIAGVLERHAIDADLVKGGHLSVALERAQLARVEHEVAHARAQGLEDEDLRLLSAGELEGRLRVAGALGASFSPHVARAHPAKLVSGLARVVEELGVPIYERTPVSEISAHRALTPMGAVRARWVVRATEGYTSTLRGMRRALVPMNSSMIVTRPLQEGVWREIGWQGSEVLGDAANVYVYAQRTADGRIAIGGRGVPYRYGSRNDGRGETAPGTVLSLRHQLEAMFPFLAGVELEHAWSGVLGVPRDWCMSVYADPASGFAWAGGYVGEGVAAANLAGRTLRDLILGEPSELTKLPIVGRQPRGWEPEPIRWASIHAVYALYRAADRQERRSGHPSRLGRLVDAVSGRA
ncbi:MAG TPA: FAD-binding oxidoreductase [Solirubrobacteraceae bacterium]|jgi:glycine/D-amino acid oxidase-like deaminating enzyme